MGCLKSPEINVQGFIFYTYFLIGGQSQNQLQFLTINYKIMTKATEQKLKIIEHYSYHLSESIGKGFSSVVYKGKNNLNSASVAIKVIDLRKLSESTMHELLQSQIKIIKALSHVNVLTCENVFKTENNCYIVTQLCQGGDLAELIKKKGRLRGIQALKIMLQIAKGMYHLSNLNIIHRDIKPANILIHEGSVKIADFGFARYQEHQGKKQRYSVGSPLYMSPQALFTNFYSKENDIWSLGVVFYEILQGRPPWQPKNQKQLKQILKQKKQIFFRIAIRDELETIIRGCLKHERSERISLESILEILGQMMSQMLSEDNLAYRETLTKRTHNTLSCKDLNQSTNVSMNNGNIVSARTHMPKIHRPPPSQHIKIANSIEQAPLIIRNRSAIELKEMLRGEKQKQKASLSLEEASRHNHWILKAVVNYSRLVYKTYSRLDKLQIKQSIKFQMQSVMAGLLQFSISWLKDSVLSLKDAEKFGIINFDKFKQTRCYSKTILVINQYYQRYIKFVTKTKRSLNDKRLAIPDQKNFTFYRNRLRKYVADALVHPSNSEHNIAIDFLISIVILSQMLQNNSTAYFAEFSKIEQIMETEPVLLTEEADIKQLKIKWETLIKSY